MPKIKYKDITFTGDKLSVIDAANLLIGEYQRQGFSLTLRQLFYQFVARDLMPDSWADKTTGVKNRPENYNKLGDLISDGRMAGLIDWSAIVDRSRSSYANRRRSVG